MDVDEYLDASPEPQGTTLTQVRLLLRSILPTAEEGMSYGVPVFKVEGKAVAGYAHAKKRCQDRARRKPLANSAWVANLQPYGCRCTK